MRGGQRAVEWKEGQKDLPAHQPWWLSRQQSWSSLLGGPYRHTHQLSQLSQSVVRAAAAVEGSNKVRAWHADRQSVRERRGVEAEQPAPLIAAHWSQRQYIAAGQSSVHWHHWQSSVHWEVGI